MPVVKRARGVGDGMADPLEEWLNDNVDEEWFDGDEEFLRLVGIMPPRGEGSHRHGVYGRQRLQRLGHG